VIARPTAVCVAVLAIHAWSAGAAGAATDVADASPTITLRVVGSRDDARAMRETLGDLLWRIGIAIAPEPPDGRPTLVDVTVDLSSGAGAPFVELTAEHPPVTICRRQLDTRASREVLIETAAQVVYTAVETRARTQGIVRAGAGSVAATGNGAAEIGATVAPIPADGAGDLRAVVPARTTAGWSGVDVAALAETRIQGRDASRPSAGGGLALTWAWRRQALGPALTVGVEYQRPVAAGDPDNAAHLGTVSVRLTPTINALALRWMTLQVGPSLAVDVSRSDGPASLGGTATPPPIMGGPFGGPMGGPAMGPAPGPIMGPAPGSTTAPTTGSGADTYSAVAFSAGAFTRWSVRVSRSAQLFAAAAVENRLGYTGSFRPPVGPGPNGGPPAGGTPTSASTWRSSLLAGIAFTVAGRPATIANQSATLGRHWSSTDRPAWGVFG
jgi:hypothetical protein